MRDDWVFSRALNNVLLRLLEKEARKDGWWRHVLQDADLILAPRGKSMDVYWKGQRLFHVRASRDELKVSTHAKYLIDPETDDAINLRDNRFQIENVKRGFMRRYEGIDTLDRMKRAATACSDAEKSGVHDIAMANPDVLDVEVTFSGIWSLGDGKKDKKSPRIDIVSLESQGDHIKLVFWEAKLFSNQDLWSASHKSVVRQIEFYRRCLIRHGDEVAASYSAVATNQLAFAEMSEGRRRVGPLTRRLSKGAPLLPLTVPDVRLIVFDFDDSQIESARWKLRRSDLLKTIPCIQVRGSTKGMKLRPCP